MKVDKIARMTTAIEHYMNGYNCAQAVALTFADVYNIDKDTLLKITSSFGCGIAHMGEICGAASAMFMLAGLDCGRTNSKDTNNQKINFSIVKMLAERFKSKHHDAICCRDILRLSKGEKIIDAPNAEIAAYYAKRPCTYRVASAAEIFCEYLNEK